MVAAPPMLWRVPKVRALGAFFWFASPSHSIAAQLADQHRQNAELRALTDKYNGEISEASRTVAALKDTNKRLQQDLRDAVAAQYKSEEARRSEEAKAEKLRDEMATFLKSSREHSARQLEAAATAVPVSSSSPYVNKRARLIVNADSRFFSGLCWTDLLSGKRWAMPRCASVCMHWRPISTRPSGIWPSASASQSGFARNWRLRRAPLPPRTALLPASRYSCRRPSRRTCIQTEASPTYVHQCLFFFLAPVSLTNPPPQKLDSLEMKQNKLDRDMEMMEENLMLSGAQPFQRTLFFSFLTVHCSGGGREGRAAGRAARAACQAHSGKVNVRCVPEN